MNRKNLAVSMALSTLLLTVSTSALSDGGFFSRLFGDSRPGVAPVENASYLVECGSCHFAYQPGLLPARSWTKLMDSLDDHFGENAELPQEDLETLKVYLVKNSAETSNHKRSQRILGSIEPSETPLRVSETRYFIKKHDELSRNMVQDNPKVVSFSNCSNCHTKAATGSFEEEEIVIPGFGRWEDD